MKISDLINELQTLQQTEGDVEVLYQFLDSDEADGKAGSITAPELVADSFFQTPNQNAIFIKPLV